MDQNYSARYPNGHGSIYDHSTQYSNGREHADSEEPELSDSEEPGLCGPEASAESRNTLLKCVPLVLPNRELVTKIKYPGDVEEDLAKILNEDPRVKLRPETKTYLKELFSRIRDSDLKGKEPTIARVIPCAQRLLDVPQLTDYHVRCLWARSGLAAIKGSRRYERLEARREKKELFEARRAKKGSRH